MPSPAAGRNRVTALRSLG